MEKNVYNKSKINLNLHFYIGLRNAVVICYIEKPLEPKLVQLTQAKKNIL